MPSAPRTRFGHPRLALGSLGLIVAIAAGVAASRLAGTNFHSVIDARVYRSAQLTAADLERYVDAFHIASIVNLQGEAAGADWYEAEVAVARRRAIPHHDLDFSARRLPTRPNVMRLIDLIERLPPPLLLHCGAGADRAGLASAVARIILDGATVDDARSELSFLYGHLPFGPQSELGRFFDLYDAYLAGGGKDHSARTFKRWVATGYVPYGYSARLDVLALPRQAEPRARLRALVRVTNTSPEPWSLSSSEAEGVKLGFRTRRDGEDAWREFDRAASPTGVIAPGATLDIDHELLAPSVPGRYELKLDLVDEHVTWFEDQGSTAVIVPLEVVREVVQ